VAGKRSRSTEEPEELPFAPKFDYKALLNRRGSSFAGERRDLMVERLKVLYGTLVDRDGKTSRNPEMVQPIPEEWEFWLARFTENPFLRFECGAFLIQPKSGPRRPLMPNDHQRPLLDHMQAMWEREIIPLQRVLKVRQDGISTYGTACSASCGLVYSESSSFTVAYRETTSVMLLRNIKFMISNLPPWDMPYDPKVGAARDNDKEFIIDGVGGCNGLKGVQFYQGSAEQGATAGRGYRFQWRHYSENDYWPDPKAVHQSVQHSEVDEFPAFSIDETTGLRLNGEYDHKHRNAMDNPARGEKAFFFPWQTHYPYRAKLDAGWANGRFANEAQFWEAAKGYSIQVYQQFVQFGCDAEQANYYLMKLAKSRSNRVPDLLFKCDFPFHRGEAFVGGTQTAFDNDALKLDQDRIAAQRPLSLAALAKQQIASFPIKPPEGWRQAFSRCRMETDEANDFKNPHWIDDEFGGNWLVWELPRRGHAYVNANDLAEGKDSTLDRRSGGPEGGDDQVIGAWRRTRDPRVDALKIVQVAQFVGKMDDLLVPTMSFCIGRMYPGAGGMQAVSGFERNGQGKLYIERGKKVTKSGDGINFILSQRFGQNGELLNFREPGIHVTVGESEAAKNVLVGNFRDAYRSGMIGINSAVTADQMSRFAKDGRGRYRGTGDKKDDAVSEAYIAIECVRFDNSGIIAPQDVMADGESVAVLMEKAGTEEIARREARLDAEFEKALSGTKGREVVATGRI
jgi:hypothetical protein